MKKLLTGIMALALVVTAMGLAQAVTDETAPAKPAEKAVAKYYVCDKCCRVALQPGKCECGSEMTEKRLLAIQAGTALLCGCPGNCQCTINKDDASKCSCGKAVMKASLKGKYVCHCGPNCQCNRISDKPGKCGCGTELKKVE